MLDQTFDKWVKMSKIYDATLQWKLHYGIVLDIRLSYFDN